MIYNITAHDMKYCCLAYQLIGKPWSWQYFNLHYPVFIPHYKQWILLCHWIGGKWIISREIFTNLNNFLVLRSYLRVRLLVSEGGQVGVNSALFHPETSQTHREASDPPSPTFLLFFFLLNPSFAKLVIM